MFAIDHAATALVIKRAYPKVAIAPILIAVQAMEFAWVALNYLGIERTTMEPAIHSVADIHLSYMPWSHSVAVPIVAALVVWLITERGFGHVALGRAVGLGIVSHLILDLLTHNHDIALWPGMPLPKLGIGLYDTPFTAFLVEFAYGVACWAVYRGRWGLLAVIVIANLANLPFLSPAIPWPLAMLDGRPLLVVSLILVQIVVTLLLVGRFSHTEQPTAVPAAA